MENTGLIARFKIEHMLIPALKDLLGMVEKDRTGNLTGPQYFLNISGDADQLRFEATTDKYVTTGVNTVYGMSIKAKPCEFDNYCLPSEGFSVDVRPGALCKLIAEPLKLAKRVGASKSTGWPIFSVYADKWTIDITTNKERPYTFHAEGVARLADSANRFVPCLDAPGMLDLSELTRVTGFLNPAIAVFPGWVKKTPLEVGRGDGNYLWWRARFGRAVQLYGNAVLANEQSTPKTAPVPAKTEPKTEPKPEPKPETAARKTAKAVAQGTNSKIVPTPKPKPKTDAALTFDAIVAGLVDVFNLTPKMQERAARKYLETRDARLAVAYALGTDHGRRFDATLKALETVTAA